MSFTLKFLILTSLSLSQCSYFKTEVTSRHRAHKWPIIPRRPRQAMSGSAFLHAIRHLGRDQRERVIYQQIHRGNIPNFLRYLVAVPVSGRSPNGKKLTGTIYVLKDYLSIGNNRDYVLTPMMPMTAARIADEFGYVLPTRKMVDAIYNAAPIKLSPHPLPAGAAMTSTPYFQRHNQIIRRSMGTSNLHYLVAGHKKDIVMTTKLFAYPTKLAIYGWHRSRGHPIQPLSTFHTRTYADYSHGVRLVRRVMRVFGRKMYIWDVLKNPQYAPLLSDEGAFDFFKLKAIMTRPSIPLVH